MLLMLERREGRDRLSLEKIGSEYFFSSSMGKLTRSKKEEPVYQVDRRRKGWRSAGMCALPFPGDGHCSDLLSANDVIFDCAETTGPLQVAVFSRR